VTVRRRLAARDEEGMALILALLFLTICAVAIGGLLTFSSTSSNATIALRTARGNDYDARATMQAAIASIRKGDTCTTNFFTPTWTLNNPSRPLRADCYVLSASSAQRNDVLLVCQSTGPTPCDSQALVRANVIFYDTPSIGNSIGIQTWSNQ
jgi:hypothetical protein